MSPEAAAIAFPYVVLLSNSSDIEEAHEMFCWVAEVSGRDIWNNIWVEEYLGFKEVRFRNEELAAMFRLRWG